VVLILKFLHGLFAKLTRVPDLLQEIEQFHVVVLDGVFFVAIWATFGFQRFFALFTNVIATAGAGEVIGSYFLI